MIGKPEETEYWVWAHDICILIPEILTPGTSWSSENFAGEDRVCTGANMNGENGVIKEPLESAVGREVVGDPSATSCFWGLQDLGTVRPVQVAGSLPGWPVLDWVSRLPPRLASASHTVIIRDTSASTISPHHITSKNAKQKN